MVYSRQTQPLSGLLEGAAELVVAQMGLYFQTLPIDRIQFAEVVGSPLLGVAGNLFAEAAGSLSAEGRSPFVAVGSRIAGTA